MFMLIFWTGCYSLLSVTRQVTGETEIFCSSEPVVSFCGSSIVLQCHLEPQQDATDNTVKWTQQSDVVHVRKGGKDIPGEQMERFEGRTSLISEGLHKGNLSLQLSSLKLSDSGRYKCSFQVGSVEKSCYVALSVRTNDLDLTKPLPHLIGRVIGVIIGAVFVLIAGLVYCKRRRNRHEAVLQRL
ncbi:butyrophilin subfamily 2 member A2-like isoform X2 [Melanotaenia boesemani]|uniref:butyrophilin subfamily 2 member A2-like isoform X2 n=1 Tax=Melanotaenia boesemani TaxID=1250792 RepID=UPI001C03BE54|nr:butyrophilin subfamily 2 member A2-like isoform X2 [Melanotaenia boesemani]